MRGFVLFLILLAGTSAVVEAANVTKVGDKDIYVDIGKSKGVQIGTNLNVYRTEEIESEFGKMRFTTQVFVGRILAYKVADAETVARVQLMTSSVGEDAPKAILKGDFVRPALVVPADDLFARDGSDLLSTGIPALKRVAHFISRFKALKVRVEVYTDSDAQDATKLTRAQAKVIREWLENDAGFKGDSLIPVG
ncbi:MAG: OmpA family protein [bacterium]|nr:OmpA family protein [bacterium]